MRVNGPLIPVYQGGGALHPGKRVSAAASGRRSLRDGGVVLGRVEASDHEYDDEEQP
jgi:hypothetical protein